MSTEDQNRCVVTVHRAEDVDALMEELTSLGNTSPWVPSRKVQMWNEKQDSLRNFDVVLTRSEMETLLQDPRVRDVRWGSKVENGIGIARNITDIQRLYSRSTTQSASHYAWSIPACINSTNPFSSNDLNYVHRYTAAGDGVDVVIQDSGIELGHPEWLNQNGTVSRFQAINWPLVSGFSGIYTQGPLHYTDTYGHGTHCAGTAAGRRYGWARNADIYAIKIFDNDAFGVSASFNMIRGWHLNKNNSRPTVVNMSWGYLNVYSGIVSGIYRGTPWTATTIQTQYGMAQTIYNDRTVDFGGYIHPTRVSSVDADIEDCIAAGIILVGAAGNDTHKIDVPGGADYDNLYQLAGPVNRYYHRGATPSATSGVICVGSVQANNQEYKSAFSCTGPRVDIYAPGEAVQSAMPVGADLAAGAVSHPDNAAFLIKKIQGTSMASPQVAGVVACLLGSRPHYSAKNCLEWINGVSTKNRLSDSGSTDYTNLQSLQGGNNRYLRWPYDSANPLIVNTTA